ncbi:TRAP transporter substrate-binding protein [Psychrobacillus sp. OK032]|uniref:TRAP transporter substrate-binding protein n=1 Tax=Psychrobacillus sp. OK032 TaxID=1884358 RepID=UPI0008B7BDCA|nr:TRAP transporter substrate-binding protein [Psychrobacillus sp. OK032]SES19142.1 tripartite ATP-independent transporter solute receptor, DctP family [Psychrobacillus sp. OK032]
MKKISSLILMVPLLMLMVGGCSGKSNSAGAEIGNGEEKNVELKIGHILTPDSHYQVMIDEMTKIAEEKSDGSIKITSFPQSQLGDEIKMIQATRSGTISMFVSGQAALENTVKEYEIFDIPYLFDSFEQANEVLAGEIGRKYLDMLEEHQLVGLGWLTAMERNVFSTKEIKEVADMRGLKLRVMQAPGYVDTYNAFGSQPTPMAYSEVYMSLQQGVVNGGDISPDQFMNDRFNEVAEYYNLTKAHYLPALLVMSQKQWNDLSDNQQKILQEAADEGLKKGIEFYAQAYEDSLKKAEESGVTIVETDLSGFKEKAEKTQESLIKSIPNGQALYDEIQAAKK